MAFRAREVFRSFEKRTPGLKYSNTKNYTEATFNSIKISQHVVVYGFLVSKETVVQIGRAHV